MKFDSSLVPNLYSKDDFFDDFDPTFPYLVTQFYRSFSRLLVTLLKHSPPICEEVWWCKRHHNTFTTLKLQNFFTISIRNNFTLKKLKNVHNFSSKHIPVKTFLLKISNLKFSTFPTVKKHQLFYEYLIDGVFLQMFWHLNVLFV